MFLKRFDIVPKPLEEVVVMFNRVIMTNLTHAVLAGIGLSMIDLSSLAQAMTWQFVLISLTSVVSMGLASWILGQVLGMYPAETAIGAGMINNSMGGTGNIAVLSAADRMNDCRCPNGKTDSGGNRPHPWRNLIQFLH